MPSIRDLVGAIAQREGVDATVVLGHDGILIDSQSATLDPDDLAARVPPIVGPADQFGQAIGRGELVTAVLEYTNGVAIVSVLSADAILLVLVSPRANIGQLLYELRRNRDHIAALV